MSIGVYKRKPYTEEHKRNIAKARKGKHWIMSEEGKENISNGSKGKRLSEEHKRKLSIANMGVKNRLGHKLSEETKRKMSESHKGRHWKWNHPMSEEIKRKRRENRIKYMSSGKMKFKDTCIELKIENELKRQDIPYMKQVPLEGMAIVDFLLPNRIVIEADGNFWHSRKWNRGRDISRDTVLGFKGYKIYRFSETQINKSVRKCVNKIYKGE